MATAMLGIALFVQPVTEAGAAVYAEPPFTGSEARLVEQIQDGPHRDWHRDRDWRRGPPRATLIIRVGAAAPDGAERHPGVGR